jgi:hypothetical protein
MQAGGKIADEQMQGEEEEVSQTEVEKRVVVD